MEHRVLGDFVIDDRHRQMGVVLDGRAGAPPHAGSPQLARYPLLPIPFGLVRAFG